MKSVLTSHATLAIWLACASAFPAPPASARPVLGLLHVHPENPRYFTDGTTMPDGSFRAVYLTGSHTWANLIDRGPSDPPPVFEFVDPDYPLTTGDPGYIASRRAMGHTRQFADRVNLAALQPRSDIASTRYCLAHPGQEYLIYQPKAEEAFSVDLRPGRYRYEWFDVFNGQTTRTGEFESAGGARRFEPLSAGEAVLRLEAVK